MRIIFGKHHWKTILQKRSDFASCRDLGEYILIDVLGSLTTVLYCPFQCAKLKCFFLSLLSAETNHRCEMFSAFCSVSVFDEICAVYFDVVQPLYSGIADAKLEVYN